MFAVVVVVVFALGMQIKSIPKGPRKFNPATPNMQMGRPPYPERVLQHTPSHTHKQRVSRGQSGCGKRMGNHNIIVKFLLSTGE